MRKTRLEGCHPEKTAIFRKNESPIAKQVMNRLVGPLQIQSVLDFGCGKAHDAEFYSRSGLRSWAYDCYEPFNRPAPPNGSRYDLATVIYVLNVLPSLDDRLDVIRESLDYVRAGGYLMMVCRSQKTIEQEARGKGWEPVSDGYWSHKAKGTFQRGINKDEMIQMAQVQPTRSISNIRITKPSGGDWALVQKVN